MLVLSLLRRKFKVVSAKLSKLVSLCLELLATVQPRAPQQTEANISSTKAQCFNVIQTELFQNQRMVQHLLEKLCEPLPVYSRRGRNHLGDSPWPKGKETAWPGVLVNSHIFF